MKSLRNSKDLPASPSLPMAMLVPIYLLHKHFNLYSLQHPVSVSNESPFVLSGSVISLLLKVHPIRQVDKLGFGNNI